jgi:PAS domain S-box-containing protein
MKLAAKAGLFSSFVILAVIAATLGVASLSIRSAIYRLETELLEKQLSRFQEEIMEAASRNGQAAARQGAAEFESRLNERSRIEDSIRLFVLEAPDRVVYAKGYDTGAVLRVEAFQPLFGAEIGTAEFDFGGRRRFCVATTIHSMDWLLVISRQKDLMLTAHRGFLVWGAWLSIFILALASGVAWFFTNRLVRRIHDALACIQKIKEGDLTARISPESVDDEFDQLQHDIDDMADRLEKNHEELLSHQRERDRQKSEKRFRNLFEHSPNAIAFHDLVFDDDGNACEYVITDANPAFETVVGRRRSDVIGKCSCDAYGTEIPPYLDTYAAVAQNGEPTGFDTFFPSLKKHFAITVYAPQPGSFVTVIADITEAKTGSAFLMESEKRFRAMFENSSDAMILAQDHIIIDCNNAAIEMYDCKSRTDLIGKHASILSPEYQPDGAATIKKIEAYIKESLEKTSIKFEWLSQTIDGTPFLSETILTTIFRRGKLIIHFAGRNISKRKETEAALKAAKDAAEAATRARAPSSPI